MRFRPLRSPSRRTLFRTSAGVAAAAALVTLAGCTSMLVVDPAEDAADPDCALPMLLMPDELNELQQRTTSSQGTTAWGEPASVIVRCGVAPPAPTTDPCVNVDGVDWVQVRADEDTWQFVTYGRTPAVEVLVTPTEVSGATALASVSSAVSDIEQTAECVSVEDAEQVDGEAPAGA
ncbi:Protein of unknown function (DUF3515) [Brevibacterium sp. Mu109]|uniref:Secreted protein n=1 Tax=Brevibacterium yomogidense TaxID=946573 RepID=A0A1X6XJZ9_9MICO|nr:MULTISPECIES: DUF3515 domain-containing protein [Brevibacterium]SLM99496.1 hypothetical protein FM105_11195 [Brevibacterium yomogidense]SMX70629.1 Protein of unknown function (DUF3515) [Brevibacterium sp. Mu109]